MSITEISANQFQEVVQAGANRLQVNAEYVNSLDVFPVPDGGTGTSMNLSVTSGAKVVVDSISEKVEELAAMLSKGLLTGAHGNSSVVLSQLFRGFSKQIPNVVSLNASDPTVAFTHGVEAAYKAVVKLVEGTILTVAREAIKTGEKKTRNTDDVVEVMTAVVKGTRRALAKAPDLLPVLKEVGVVDSRRQGLLSVYEGFLNALNGESQADETYEPSPAEMDNMVNTEHRRGVQGQVATEDIHFDYCTEIVAEIGEKPIVDSMFDYEEFRNYLDGIGDSLLMVGDNEIIKVHVHTESSGKILNYGQKFDSLVKIRVDSMRLQHKTVSEHDEEVSEFAKEETPCIPYGIVAIVAGKGVQELFKSLGINYVTSGGQTMNPSMEGVVKAIQKMNADRVIVLPNNKNISMVANQATEVADIPVAVVPSRTISQGLTAILSFNDQASLEENKKTMTEILSSAVSGQVTHAIRDTSIDDIEIKEDDFPGMTDGKIMISNPDITTTTLSTLEQMISEGTGIITILADDEEAVKRTDEFAEKLTEKHPDLEIEIHQGDQPVYPYLFSAEQFL